MNIYDALKQASARLSYGSRWLIMEEDGTYIVYEHKYGRKKSTLIIETANEEKAVAALLEMEEGEQ